ncbi:MAG: succinylglutamate desuccinylase/aspartoacylase family protein [Rhodoferax sp.]|nr:succinylglutamate desuccinylase/aspartoacylase family protein [Rhodoferax sp.]
MTLAPPFLHLHSFRGFEPGPRLLVLGAVHGNETAGTRGIERVIAELEGGSLTLRRGSLTLVPVTNPLAYMKKQRMGDRNLNRNLYPNAAPQDYEDHIANVLCPLLAENEVLLDLHSFHTAGEPFAMIGPPNNDGVLEPFAHAEKEQALALRLGPRRIVEGWLDTYAAGVQKRLARTQPSERAQLLSTDPRYGVGTTETMRSQGGYGVTLECGQHEDPAAPPVAWRAIRNTLAHLNMVDAANPAANTGIELLRLAEVVDRLHADDHFVQPWASYDRVAAGQAIARRHDGSVLSAPRDGHIVFPNPAALAGNEWFYFAQASQRDLGT